MIGSETTVKHRLALGTGCGMRKVTQ